LDQSIFVKYDFLALFLSGCFACVPRRSCANKARPGKKKELIKGHHIYYACSFLLVRVMAHEEMAHEGELAVLKSWSAAQAYELVSSHSSFKFKVTALLHLQP